MPQIQQNTGQGQNQYNQQQQQQPQQQQQQNESLDGSMGGHVNDQERNQQQENKKPKIQKSTSAKSSKKKTQEDIEFEEYERNCLPPIHPRVPSHKVASSSNSAPKKQPEQQTNKDGSSKPPRFPGQNRTRGLNYKDDTPGPGTYTASPNYYLSHYITPKQFTFKHRPQPKIEPSLGPGTYNPKDTYIKPDMHVATIHGHDLPNASDADPGPCAYKPSHTLVEPRVLGMEFNSRPGIGKFNKNPGPGTYKPGFKHKYEPPHYSLGVKCINITKDFVPGPGEYALPPTEVQSNKTQQKTHLMTERHGHIKDNGIPGPGAYCPKKENVLQSTPGFKIL